MKRLYFRIAPKWMLSFRWLPSPNKVMIITEGEYVYPFFNAYFVQNMLSLSLYALSRGYRPYIELAGREGKYTDWGTFFCQPLSNEKALESHKKAIQCNRPRGYYTYWMTDVHKKRETKRWAYAFQKLLRLNPSTLQYCDAELQQIRSMANGKILGVLARGTDYVDKRPKGHPVQPKLMDMLNDCEQFLKLHTDYDKIYLATEDERIKHTFVERFGIEMILENKRDYFYEKYQAAVQENSNLDITDVGFSRQNEYYVRGLRYLSSMYILSRCDSLIAGNCGGTTFAYFWNNQKYEFAHIYNLGTYE